MANVSFAKWVRMKGRHANPRIHALRTRGQFPWMERPVFWWEVQIDVGDFTPESDTEQTLDLDALYPDRPFVNNVYLLPGAEVVILTLFAGATTCTIQVGDTNDPNGLVTATNLHTGTTGVPISTPSAAEYALRSETGYLPIATLTTTVENVDDLTAGSVLVRIPFSPHRET